VIAAIAGNIDTVVALAKLGADVAIFFDESFMNEAVVGEAIGSVELVTGMIASVCGSKNGLSEAMSDGATCTSFSWIMILSSALHKRIYSNPSGDEISVVASESVDNEFVNKVEDTHTTCFEKAMALSLECMSDSVIDMLSNTTYTKKRGAARVAAHVYHDTLLVDGSRIDINKKAKRFVELACFFLNEDMQNDVVALRLTCKANNDVRRFPVVATDGQLEANLIESFIAYDSTRFVETSLIFQSLRRNYTS
jgi:hypothetical protein